MAKTLGFFLANVLVAVSTTETIERSNNVIEKALARLMLVFMMTMTLIALTK